MFLLARKLVFWFFINISIIYIYLRDSTILAQPHLIAHACENAAKYTENSRYKVNLDITLSTLLTTNSGFGFFNLSTGTGNDRVNSIALCRGDVLPSLCQSCVNDSIARLRLVCPNQKQAIGYYDECMLKYSSDTPSGNTLMNFYQPYENDQKAADVDRFNGVLIPLLDKLRGDAAAGGPLLKFATGNMTGPDVTRIYGLVQCTPDLSQLQCSDCLEKAIKRFLSEFSGKVGGRALVPLCNFRYEITRFFNGSTSAISPPPSGGNRKRVLITALVAGAAAILVVIIVCFKRICKWRRKAKNHVNIENFLKNHEFLAPKRYSYSQVKKMTNSFEVKLGQGGFGSVYKGALSNGNQVAVKVLNELKGSGEDFINEVASVGQTSHVNIVSLVGFCFASHHRALIYEFMPNGSLERFIYNQASSSNNQLGWKKLQEIAIGVARGLQYLHSGCNTRILHCDIKPHNILLDQDFNPKISDFGLAKLFPEKKSMISMSHMRGTPGYIAPEVFSRKFGQVSHKSDVYSYGMMILEMVGGRKNIEDEVDHTSENFPHWIHEKLELHEEQLGLHGIVSEEENQMARKMIIVGLWCIQTNPLSRPTITKVLEMLEGDMTSLEIPPKPFLSSPSRSFGSQSTG